MRIARICAAAVAGVALTLAGCSGKTPEERLERASMLLQQRDTLAATLEAREIIKKYPDHPAAVHAHGLLSQVYLMERRPDEALAELEAVLEKVPQTNQFGREALGTYLRLLEQMRRFDDAFKTIDRYQSEYADDHMTSLSLTVARISILTNSGQTTEARTMLVPMRETTTEPATRMLYLEMLSNTHAAEGDTTKALELFLDGYDQEQADTSRRSISERLSRYYASQSDYTNTRLWLARVTELFEKALRTELDANRRAEMTLDLAMLYVQSGNVAGAEKAIRELYGTGVGRDFQMPVIQIYANVLLRGGKYEEAVEFLRDATRKYPELKLDVELARLESMHQQNQLMQQFPADTSTLALRFNAEPLVPAGASGDAATTAPAVEAVPVEAPAPAVVATPTEAPAPADAATTPTASDAPAAPDATAVQFVDINTTPTN